MADVPLMDFSALGGLYDDFRKAKMLGARDQALANLQQSPDGSVDFTALSGNLLRAGDFQGAMQSAQTAKALQPQSTDEIKEYNLDRTQRQKAGLPERSFFDFKAELKRAGATRINNSITTGDNQYAKELAGLNAKNDFEIQKAAQNASGAITNLNTMNRLLDNPSLYTGAGGESVNRVKSILKAAGVNVEGVPEAELFRALSNKTVLDATGGSLGVAISNADRDFLQQISPNLSNNPDSNRMIIANALKIEQRKQDIAKWAREYKTLNRGQLDAGFQDYLAKKAEENQLFARPQNQQTQPQAQQRLAPPRPGEVRKGYRFKGGNPADQNSWEPVQ